MKNTNKKVLVIEDNEKHMSDAKMLVEKYPLIDFTFCSTFEGIKSAAKESNILMVPKKFDAILTDIHFPVHENNSEASPIGLTIMLIAALSAVPVHMLTDKDHHDDDMEWLNRIFIDVRRVKNEMDAIKKSFVINDPDISKSDVVSLGLKDQLDENGCKAWQECMEEIINNWKRNNK